MARLVSALLPILAISSAFAQTSAADAPAEQASSTTVIIFIVLFLGSCVGFGIYTWWSARKNKQG